MIIKDKLMYLQNKTNSHELIYHKNKNRMIKNRLNHKDTILKLIDIHNKDANKILLLTLKTYVWKIKIMNTLNILKKNRIKSMINKNHQCLQLKNKQQHAPIFKIIKKEKSLSRSLQKLKKILQEIKRHFLLKNNYLIDFILVQINNY
jgi:hypothetical protein